VKSHSTFCDLDCGAPCLSFFWKYSWAYGIKVWPYLTSRGLMSFKKFYCKCVLSFALSKNFLWSFNKVAASGLSVGSLCKQAFTNASNSALNWPAGRLGGGEFKITRSTFIAVWDELGASPWASSIAVIPSDQISALKSYPSVYSATSGAIQQGEPTNVDFFWPSFTWALTPKSLM